MKTKGISKLRSKNYEKVIEVNVPIRFYWVHDGFDGFEFGSLEKCSKYQIGLLRKIINQLAFEHQCGIVADYMLHNHKEEWLGLLDKIESETEGIPQSFIKAFEEK